MHCPFLSSIQDPRLRHLIKTVWDRLPEMDQLSLSHLILEISESTDHFVPGPQGTIYVEDDFTGPLATLMETTPQAVVTLGTLKEVPSDAAAMAVVAHELAHVLLRHHHLGPIADVMCGLRHCNEQDSHALTEWFEDQAELQVWFWGFQQEMAAFYDLYPGSRQPRWIITPARPAPSKPAQPPLRKRRLR